MIIISVIVFDDWPWQAFSGAEPSVRENIDQSLMVIDQESKYHRQRAESPIQCWTECSTQSVIINIILGDSNNIGGDLWQGRQELNDYH